MDQDSNPQPLDLSQFIYFHPKLQILAVGSTCQLIRGKPNFSRRYASGKRLRTTALNKSVSRLSSISTVRYDDDWLSLSLSLSPTHFHSIPCSLSLTHTHTHTHTTLSHIHTNSFTHTHTHTLSISLTHTRTFSSLAHSFTQALTRTFLFISYWWQIKAFGMWIFEVRIISGHKRHDNKEKSKHFCFSVSINRSKYTLKRLLNVWKHSFKHN